MIKHLLTGPAGSGKTRRVLAGFRESLKKGNRGLIVVPTATLADHLRHELARDGLVFRAQQVSTLAQFIESLAPKLKPLPDHLFHLMVEQSLAALQLPEFQRVAELPGFHARLVRTISDLDAAGCTPAALAGMKASLAPFRDAVVRVWQDVDRQMRQRGMVTRGELLREAARAAGTQAGRDHVWFDGFAQLSGPDIDFIDAVSSSANVTLTLANEGLSPDLKATLLHRGFAEEILTGQRAAQTVLMEPESAEREVEEIARRILARAGDGEPFHEMGIALRKPEKYVPLLRAALERFGIPAHFYFSEPLPAHAAARLMGGAVEALLNGWEHEQVLEMIRFVPAFGLSDGMDGFSVNVLENLPGRGLDALLDLAGARMAPQRVLKSLQQIDAWKNDRRTPGEWAARLGHLASLFWPGHVADRISRGEAAQYRLQAAGFKAFATAMESAADWWVNQSDTLDMAAFWRVARSVVRLTTLATKARSRNVVHVISAWEARQWDLATLFVCGMVEKDFPAQNGQDPFFSDTALRDLARQGIRVQTAQDKDEEERGLFEAVSARARDLLVLSYPRTDSRGQRNLKSIFLKDREAEVTRMAVRPALPAPIAQWVLPSRISSPDLLETLAERHVKISVTALESLLQCPFQFFAARTLQIKELPSRPEDRLDFLTQGNIAHAVLQEWFGTREELEPLFNKVFAETCAKCNIQPGFRMDRLGRALLIALRQFIEDDQYPLPLGSQAELKFELPMDDHLSISGKLDRIDELEDGRAVLIDYKFSNAANTKNKLNDKTKLQGPLYAWAATKEFGRETAAMLYISLKGGQKPEYVGWGEVPGAKLKLIPIPDGWIPNALQKTSEAVAQFRLGTIHPQPTNPDPCRFCDFRDACRVGRPAAIPATGS